MEAKHTPGPWGYTFQSHEDGDSTHFIHNATDRHAGSHARTFINRTVSKEQAEANAKLIAAAPELLEALRNIISVIPEDSDIWEDSSQEWQIKDAISEAEKAINKATN